MISQPTYIRIMRASAFYDLVVTIGFATPWTYLLILDLLQATHLALNLPGTLPSPDTFQVLLGNLMGSVVTVWSLARLHQSSVILGRYDALARILFAIWQINAVFHGASAVILALTLVELAFFVAQILPVRADKAEIFHAR